MSEFIDRLNQVREGPQKLQEIRQVDLAEIVLRGGEPSQQKHPQKQGKSTTIQNPSHEQHNKKARPKGGRSGSKSRFFNYGSQPQGQHLSSQNLLQKQQQPKEPLTIAAFDNRQSDSSADDSHFLSMSKHGLPTFNETTGQTADFLAGRKHNPSATNRAQERVAVSMPSLNLNELLHSSLDNDHKDGAKKQNNQEVPGKPNTNRAQPKPKEEVFQKQRKSADIRAPLKYPLRDPDVFSDRIKVLQKYKNTHHNPTIEIPKPADEEGMFKSQLPSIVKVSHDQSLDLEHSTVEVQDELASLSRAKSMKNIFHSTNKAYKLRFVHDVRARVNAIKSNVSVHNMHSQRQGPLGERILDPPVHRSRNQHSTIVESHYRTTEDAAKQSKSHRSKARQDVSYLFESARPQKRVGNLPELTRSKISISDANLLDRQRHSVFDAKRLDDSTQSLNDRHVGDPTKQLEENLRLFEQLRLNRGNENDSTVPEQLPDLKDLPKIESEIMQESKEMKNVLGNMSAGNMPSYSKVKNLARSLVVERDERRLQEYAEQLNAHIKADQPIPDHLLSFEQFKEQRAQQKEQDGVFQRAANLSHDYQSEMPELLITPRNILSNIQQEASVENISIRDKNTSLGLRNSSRIVDLSPKKYQAEEAGLGLRQDSKSTLQQSSPKQTEKVKPVKKLKLKRIDLKEQDKKPSAQGDKEMSALEKMKSYLKQDLIKEQQKLQRTKDSLQFKLQLSAKDPTKMNISEKPQVFDLGQPSSRQDAIILNQWFEKMIHSAQLMDPNVRIGDAILSDMFPEKMSSPSQDLAHSIHRVILNLTIKEACRQVTVHCQERGTLIRQLFEMMFSLIVSAQHNYMQKLRNLETIWSQKLREMAQMHTEKLIETEQRLQTSTTKLNHSNAHLQLKLRELANSQRHQRKLFKQNRELIGYNSQMETKLKVLQRELAMNKDLINSIVEQHNRKKRQRQEMDIPQDGQQAQPLDSELDNYISMLENLKDTSTIMNEVEREQIDLLDNSRDSQEIDNELEHNLHIDELHKQTDMADFVEHLTEWLGGPPTIEKHTQVTPRQYKQRRLQVDAHQLGLMVDRSAFANIRILDGKTVNTEVKKVKMYDEQEENEGNQQSRLFEELEFERPPRSKSQTYHLYDNDLAVVKDNQELLLSDCQLELNKDFEFMRKDKMYPKKFRPYMTPFEELELKYPQLKKQLVDINDDIFGQGNFDQQNVKSIRAILKELIKSTIPNITTVLEEYHKLRENWRHLLLGLIQPSDVLKGQRKQKKQELENIIEQVKKKQANHAQEAFKRRQTVMLDEVEIAKFVIKEELKSLVDLNSAEMGLVVEIKNMLQSENIDIKVISEVKQLLEELKDKVGESGNTVKDRLLKNRFLGKPADDDSAVSSDAESSQVDTHLDLKSMRSGKSDKKQKQLRLRRRLSKIAENAMNLKLSQLSKIMMKIVSFVNKNKPEAIRSKAMPKKMLMQHLNRIFSQMIVPSLRKKQTTVDFLQCIYDYAKKKYGTLVVEPKFSLFVYGLYAYRDKCPRMALFTRLAGLLPEQINATMTRLEKAAKSTNETMVVSFAQPIHVFRNYQKYIEQLHNILNFQISELDLATHISVSQAQNIFRQRFEQKYKHEKDLNRKQRALIDKLSFFLTAEEVKSYLWLSKLAGYSRGRPTDKNRGVWVVDIDDLYLNLLDEGDKVIAANAKTVDDIFRAADADKNHIMDFAEFKQIMAIYQQNHQSDGAQASRFTPEKIEEMFLEFAQPPSQRNVQKGDENDVTHQLGSASAFSDNQQKSQSNNTQHIPQINQMNKLASDGSDERQALKSYEQADSPLKSSGRKFHSVSPDKNSSEFLATQQPKSQNRQDGESTIEQEPYGKQTLNITQTKFIQSRDQISNTTNIENDKTIQNLQKSATEQPYNLIEDKSDKAQSVKTIIISAVDKPSKPKKQANLLSQASYTRSNIGSQVDNQLTKSDSNLALTKEQFRNLCFNYDIFQKVPDNLYDAVSLQFGRNLKQKLSQTSQV